MILTKPQSGFPVGTEVVIVKSEPLKTKWGEYVLHVTLPDGKRRILFPDEVTTAQVSGRLHRESRA